MKYFLAILLLLNSILCHAAIYMQSDQNGNAVFSDTPLSPNAQKISIGRPQTVSSSTTTEPTPEAPLVLGAHKSSPANKNTKAPIAEENVKLPYTVFEIESPKDQDTIQNQPSFPVLMRIEPKLQPGDKVQLFIDGQPWGEPRASAQLQLDLVDRGTHQLYAELIDANGTVLKQTSPITFFNHRAALGSQSGGGI